MLSPHIFVYISSVKNSDIMNIEPVAYYHSSLPTKFGVPRQSGLVPELVGYVSFMPQYRNSDSLRGIEGFDYLWLIWGFSLNDRKSGAWSPLVRPPLLGGNEYMGVFATRSPFRPNPLGLSSVRLIGVEEGSEGVMLIVAGADLVDGTPIYDIKPYVVYSDAHPSARSGFVDSNKWQTLDVVIPENMHVPFGDDDLRALRKILELDPRPQYHDDPERVYGMLYSGYDVRFKVSSEGVLEVVGFVGL